MLSLEPVTTHRQDSPSCRALTPLRACGETWGGTPEPSSVTTVVLLWGTGVCGSEMKMFFFFFSSFLTSKNVFVHVQ